MEVVKPLAIHKSPGQDPGFEQKGEKALEETGVNREVIADRFAEKHSKCEVIRYLLAAFWAIFIGRIKDTVAILTTSGVGHRLSFA